MAAALAIHSRLQSRYTSDRRRQSESTVISVLGRKRKGRRQDSQTGTVVLDQGSLCESGRVDSPFYRIWLAR